MHVKTCYNNKQYWHYYLLNMCYSYDMTFSSLHPWGCCCTPGISGNYSPSTAHPSNATLPGAQSRHFAVRWCPRIQFRVCAQQTISTSDINSWWSASQGVWHVVRIIVLSCPVANAASAYCRRHIFRQSYLKWIYHGNSEIFKYYHSSTVRGCMWTYLQQKVRNYSSKLIKIKLKFLPEFLIPNF